MHLYLHRKKYTLNNKMCSISVIGSALPLELQPFLLHKILKMAEFLEDDFST